MTIEKNIKELDYDEYLRISDSRFRLAKELFRQKFIIGKDPASNDTQDNLAIYEALSDMYDDNKELLRQAFIVADEYEDIGNLYNESLDDLELCKKTLDIACEDFVKCCEGCEDRSFHMSDDEWEKSKEEYKQSILEKAKEELESDKQ